MPKLLHHEVSQSNVSIM